MLSVVLLYVGSFLPRWVNYVEYYHVVSADTNVIEPRADGVAGYAIGVV
jgi:hypothetical protein